jgi:DHA1 family inner membrane transport protein
MSTDTNVDTSTGKSTSTGPHHHTDQIAAKNSTTHQRASLAPISSAPLSSTPHNVSNWRLTIALFVFVAFLLGCNEFIIVGVTSDIAHDFSVTLSQVGILVTAFATTYVIATPLIVSLTNRFDRYWVLLVSVLIFVASNALTALTPNLPSLIAARILTACVAGVIISLLLVFGNIIAPPIKRPIVVAVIYSGYNIASIVGVPLGTALAGRTDWRTCFWVITMLSVLTLPLLAHTVTRGTTQERAPFTTQFRLLKDRRILLGCLTIILTYISMYAFYTYIRPILTQVLGYSQTQMELLLSLLGIASVIGNFGAGWVSARLGMRSVVAVEAISALAAVLLAPASRTGWVGVILLCVLCLVLVMPSVVLQAMFLAVSTQDYPQAVNLSSTLDPLCSNIGIALGSLTASLAIRSIPLRNVGFLSAAFAAIAFVSALALMHSLQSRSQHDAIQKTRMKE